MILKWRAVCPTCAHRISRRGILSDTMPCPGCGVRLKQNDVWNRNAMIAVAAVGLIGGTVLILATLLTFATRRLGSRSVYLAGVAYVVLLLVAAAWAWPYGTKYDLASPPEAPEPPEQ